MTSRTVYVGNLAPQVNEYMLLKLYQPYGEITDIHFMWEHLGEERQKGAPRGYCFIQFKTEAEALKAMDGTKDVVLAGKPLKVQIGQQRTEEQKKIQKANLVRPLNPEDKIRLIESKLKQLEKPNPKKRSRSPEAPPPATPPTTPADASPLDSSASSSSSSSSSPASSSTSSTSSNSSASSSSSSAAPSSPVSPASSPAVSVSSGASSASSASSASAVSADSSVDRSAEVTARTVYVGNLAPTVSAHMLLKVYEPYGKITDFRLEKGARRGHCFIQFKTEAEALKAVEGTRLVVIAGKPLKVQIGATPSDDVSSDSDQG